MKTVKRRPLGMSRPPVEAPIIAPNGRAEDMRELFKSYSAFVSQ